ncbi:MoaD/ThiS family protein [Marinicrinis sediminis]|uniref:Molybdopterin synthase sulfur carrier subunit n=1 Tax=Marinicrinis sediminis TaxID=1652465 RepID=A0ABW5R5N4_9BACL
MVKVLLFAAIAEKTGRREWCPELGQGTVGQVVEQLVMRFPQIRDEIGTCLFAKNERVVDQDDEVGHGDVLAILPPVNGG